MDAKGLDDGRPDEPTESDWLFEYIDSVIKSPAWDAEVMGFIDENCMVFDNEEVRCLYSQNSTIVETINLLTLRNHFEILDVSGKQIRVHRDPREIPRSGGGITHGSSGGDLQNPQCTLL